MTVTVELSTPLADALNAAIPPKLEEHGWATGGGDDVALTEYIVLMLANGKTRDEVTKELSTDLLGLDPSDEGLNNFCNWLFATVDTLAAQYGVSDGQSNAAAFAAPGNSLAADGDHDMDIASTDSLGELNAPTGPKAMRNGTDTRGRGKRILGQMNRAMDRTHESVLHRVRGGSGSDRINTHNRGPPTGPRMGAGRLPRGPNPRAASIQHGLQHMNNMPPAMNGNMGGMPGWGMAPGQQQPDMMSVLQQQQNLLNQMQQQLMAQTGQNGGFNGRGRGRSIMDRSSRGNFRGRGGHHQNGFHAQSADGQPKDPNAAAQGDDSEMGGTREPTNPEDTVCRYNLRCTNKDCKLAHQSPAAPPGATVDVSDVCTFGAACKNYKCVGRHPSPATKTAHQSEQDCKFWPNCQNPRCPFKHPSKPPCRNGGDCNVAGCDFYHTTVMCKYKPCTNRYCTFKHEEGQRGPFPDKVWTADGTNQHVSERKFADADAAEEAVIPGAGDDAMGGTEQQPAVEVKSEIE